MSVKLADKTKPGHRTLCCFHLVDPTLRIRSTATVPPQQEAWLWKAVSSDINKLTKLPCDDDQIGVEVRDFMVKDGSTITYDEALERREALSKERRADAQVIDDNFWIPED